MACCSGDNQVDIWGSRPCCSVTAGPVNKVYSAGSISISMTSASICERKAVTMRSRFIFPVQSLRKCSILSGSICCEAPDCLLHLINVIRKKRRKPGVRVFSSFGKDTFCSCCSLQQQRRSSFPNGLCSKN